VHTFIAVYNALRSENESGLLKHRLLRKYGGQSLQKSEVVFVRYSLTNYSEQAISDIHITNMEAILSKI
jgi:hypothetical protein